MSEEEKTENANEGRTTPSAARRYERRMGDVGQRPGSSHIWLISFTDVMALMLTFFVLLFAMSKPEAKTWSEITAALQNELNRFYGPQFNRGLQDAVNLNKVNFNQALSINYLKALIEKVISENEVLENVRVIPQEDHLILSLPQEFLFDTGSVTVNEEGTRAIYALGGALSRIHNSVEIAGHADPRPVAGEGGQYQNNWELSIARAASVAGLLKNVGYGKNVTIRGFSSGRYKDLAGVVETEGERLDLSRRVDIIVRDYDESKRKVFFTLELP